MGSELCWIQDPRVAYLEDHMTYFMFYDLTCYGGYHNQHYIAFATNFNPLNQTSWNQSFETILGYESENFQNPAVLFQNGQHYLFFGAIDVAGKRKIEYMTLTNDYKWPENGHPKIFMLARPSYFDNTFVTPGPPPIQMRSGDFLFLYNGIDSSYCSKIGYVVLNGSQPVSQNYIQRSDTPLIPMDSCMTVTGVILHPKGCPPNLTDIIDDFPPENTECFWIAFGVDKNGNSPTKYFPNTGSARIIVAWKDLISTEPTSTEIFTTILPPNTTTTYSSTIGTTGTTTNSGSSKLHILWIALSAIIIIVAIVILSIFLYTRIQVKKRKEKIEELAEILRKLNMTDDDIKEFNKNKDQFLINRKNLTIDFDVVLGKGASSTVQKGFLKGRSPLLNLEKNSIKCQQYQDCDVAVKVASTLGQIEATRWMQEIEAIKRLGYNEYIVNMLGWCINKNSYCLAFEMATSDLLTYVRSLSIINKSEINLKHFIAYLWQISNAMSFIASCRMVHRDLAARNILLFGDNKAKVSDFGLCCDLDRDTLTYQASLTKRLPIKWLSIEALTERRFSEKSDVWSFGILMYEMFSLGKVPYVSLQNGELISFLSHGNRLERFEDVPDEINQIMGSCWENDSAQRPTFENLILQFRNILEESTESYGYIQ